MQNDAVAARLDVRAFAQAGGSLAGREDLATYPRLHDAGQHDSSGSMVRWNARGEVRADRVDQPQVWLHLGARAVVPRTCQRCLGRVDIALSVDRWFRFVPDEATAAAQDDGSEEDLLVLASDFDLHDLIEDELLLELPYIARHEACPVQPRLSTSDPDFLAEPDRPNPFAALVALKSSKGHRSS